MFFTGLDLQDNKAEQQGGSIKITQVLLDFFNNYWLYNIFFFKNYGTVVFNVTKFVNNSVSRDGGALYIDYSQNSIQFHNSEFLWNSAVKNGGSLFFSNNKDTISLKNTKIKNNIAE